MSSKLPSQTIVNQKQNVSAITLRSRKVLEQPKVASKPEIEKELEKEVAVPQANKSKESSREQPKSIVIPPPFPSRFAKSKKEEEEKEILETFRKVEVNILLLDAIKQVPHYANFSKICAPTRKS